MVVRTTSFRRGRGLAGALISGALLASLAVAVVPVAADDLGVLPVTHEHWNGLDPITNNGDGAAGQATRNGGACSTASSSAANVNTDCGRVGPHNETSIAVDPTNSSHLVGGANDYQLSISPGGSIFETIYSRAHVSWDAGSTWHDYPLTNQNAYTATGDPAIAFDADGKVYYATLGFTWSQASFCCVKPDVVVETSSDGGVTWSPEHRVSAGTGIFTNQGPFNDKEYVAAWGHGNAIVTWTIFNQGLKGAYISSPIYDSVTHDGGNTWSAPQVISGSATFCVGTTGGNSCNSDQFSTPAVAADGSVYVSFVNTSDFATGRDQYLVVKVSPTTGARVGGPWKVGGIYDGSTDYPINVDGRQTLQDSEFRTNASGNLSADPTHANHLVVVWSDMRNSTLPHDPDPFVGTTNSDVIWSESWDGGATWSSPAAIATQKDQFQPWSTFDASGNLWIGAFDREWDSANHTFKYALSENEGAFAALSTAASDPTSGDRWFSGGVVNHATTFMGDYSGIATDGTNVYGYWTDLRIDATFPPRTGHGEDAFFGR